jgi:hypothetical protein
MSSVSKPITPADDSLTCDLPIGLQPAGDSCVESVDGLLADCPSAGDPPSCNQAISTCTPIHSCYNTTERFGINDPSRNHIRPVLAVNIAPYILGPMPPDAFLDRFLPSHSISIPEGTPNFQAGMFTSLLPPTGATSATDATDATGATGSSGATKPTPYKAIVCISALRNSFEIGLARSY